MLALGSRREVALALDSRPASSSQRLIWSAGEAKTAMGGLLAQELKLMRGEIDHQQLAAGLEQTRGFEDGRCGIVEKVQHLVQDHCVGGAVG